MRIVRPSGSSINLRLYTTEAGASVQSTPQAVDSLSFLQLTSISPINTRKVNVQITSGSVPLGTILTLKAYNCPTGAGLLGVGQTVTFNGSTSFPLITGIGSCYTGTTTSFPNNVDGYRLKYTWSPDPTNLGSITAFTSYQLQITFTFTN
jgi:hypothetical protein